MTHELKFPMGPSFVIPCCTRQFFIEHVSIKPKFYLGKLDCDFGIDLLIEPAESPERTEVHRKSNADVEGRSHPYGACFQAHET